MTNEEIKKRMETAVKWHEVAQQCEKDGSLKLNSEIHPDNIFIFMTNWITFNYLYGSLYYNDGKYEYGQHGNFESINELHDYIIGKYDGELLSIIGIKSINRRTNLHEYKWYSERTQILLYLDTIMEKLKVNNFLSYALSIEVKNDAQDKVFNLWDKEVRNLKQPGKSTKELREFLIDESNPDTHRIVALIMTIYQIRCNLFHGSKNPDCERDRALVTIAGKIINRLLEII